MDTSWLSRTELLIGKENLEKLGTKHVLVVGLGGVGSFAAEFICRAGIGEMTIVDGDVVDPTNRNRQLPALATNHGVPKVEIMAERLLAINPELKLHTVREFLTPEKCEAILETPFDYVMDCIDSITPKLLLITTAYQKGFSMVSAMGAGGKTDPTQIRIADLFDTYNCKLAHYVRKRIRRLGVKSGIKAVFSTEEVDKDSLILTDGSNFKLSAYGTMSYLPALFGGTAASVVIRDLIGMEVVLSKKPITKSKKKSKK